MRPYKPTPRDLACPDNLNRLRRICNPWTKRIWTLDIPEEEKPPIMEQRRYTTTAWRQFGSSVHYTLPRGDKPIPDDDEGEELHITDPDLADWRDKLNGKSSTLRSSFSKAWSRSPFSDPTRASTKLSSRRAARSESRPASPLAGETSPSPPRFCSSSATTRPSGSTTNIPSFKPKAFTLGDERRGVIVRYAPPVKRGSKAHITTTLLPGSLIWANDGVKYDLLEWRTEDGARPRQAAKDQRSDDRFLPVGAGRGARLNPQHHSRPDLAEPDRAARLR